MIVYRDGCRPFIELYSNLSTRLYTSSLDYDKLAAYTRGFAEPVQWRDINTSVDFTTDIMLVVYHARSTIGSKMLAQAKLTQIKMVSAQFNLFFEPGQGIGMHRLSFTVNDLDDVDEIDRFPHDFKLEVLYEVLEATTRPTSEVVNAAEVAQNEILLIRKPDCVFSEKREYENFMEQYGLEKPKKAPPPKRPPPPALSSSSSST